MARGNGEMYILETKIYLNIYFNDILGHSIVIFCEYLMSE